jgi:hypothetical protein
VSWSLLALQQLRALKDCEFRDCVWIPMYRPEGGLHRLISEMT